MVVIKILKGKDFRRFNAPETITWDNLHKILQQLFPRDDLSLYNLRYKDDEGDMVSICSTSELQEAINVSTKMQPPILRLQLLVNQGGTIQHVDDQKCTTARKQSDTTQLPRADNSKPIISATRAKSVNQAVQFLLRVENTFAREPHKYHTFLQLLKKFKSKECDVEYVKVEVESLFYGHPDLLLDFNIFLPSGKGVVLKQSQPPPQPLNNSKNSFERLPIFSGQLPQLSMSRPNLTPEVTPVTTPHTTPPSSPNLRRSPNPSPSPPKPTLTPRKVPLAAVSTLAALRQECSLLSSTMTSQCGQLSNGLTSDLDALVASTTRLTKEALGPLSYDQELSDYMVDLTASTFADQFGTVSTAQMMELQENEKKSKQMEDLSASTVGTCSSISTQVDGMCKAKWNKISAMCTPLAHETTGTCGDVASQFMSNMQQEVMISKKDDSMSEEWATLSSSVTTSNKKLSKDFNDELALLSAGITSTVMSM